MAPTAHPFEEPTRSWSPSPAPATTAMLPAELADHPRYRLVEMLGEGGMGRVYKAEHRLMNRFVAVKVVRDALLDRPAVRERFVRELRTAAQLAHPNIVAAHDAEQAGNVCFLVMEYIPGDSLAQLVKRRGPLPAAEACGYIRQAALGLQHAHERGLVHRDIKPGNLMLTADGVVKVLDFGLARFTLERAAEQAPAGEANAPRPATLSEETASEAGVGTPSSVAAEHTASGALVGTPAYMAPEQARNARAADIRSDIYSLGCTLAYLVSGKHQPQTGLPAGLAAVLGRMQAPNPVDRYQTPSDVAEALAPFCQASSAARAGRRRLAVIVGMLAVSAVAVFLATRFFQGPDDNGESASSNKKTDSTDVAKVDVPKDGSAHIAPATDKPGDKPKATGQGSTTIVVQLSPQPLVKGQAVTITATIVPITPPTGKPGGGATFYDGEEIIGYAGMKENQASLTIGTLKPGLHSIRVAYDGDADYSRSFSSPVQVTIP